MLSNEVHFGGPDLDFHGDAVIPNHNSVQRAVAIGFRVLNVVLEATIHWMPQVVYLHKQTLVIMISVIVTLWELSMIIAL